MQAVTTTTTSVTNRRERIRKTRCRPWHGMTGVSSSHGRNDRDSNANSPSENQLLSSQGIPVRNGEHVSPGRHCPSVSISERNPRRFSRRDALSIEQSENKHHRCFYAPIVKARLAEDRPEVRPRHRRLNADRASPMIAAPS